MDIAQILSLLPSPPAKLLDVGVGSGWTSEIFARRGYEVLGLDISPDMIQLANKRAVEAKFSVCDYETGPIPEGFNIAISTTPCITPKTSLPCSEIFTMHCQVAESW